MRVAVCEVHHGRDWHRPVSYDQEFHHAVPRAWQAVWTPETPPAPGTYHVPFGGVQQLWDVRGVQVPPTCHRNVHTWIVAIMHSLAAMPDATLGEAQVRNAAHLVLATAGYSPHVQAPRDELQVAQLAPIRWLQAGGDLNYLIGRKMWGEA